MVNRGTLCYSSALLSLAELGLTLSQVTNLMYECSLYFGLPRNEVQDT